MKFFCPEVGREVADGRIEMCGHNKTCNQGLREVYICVKWANNRCSLCETKRDTKRDLLEGDDHE